jgi:hypothetical protein
MARKFEMVTPKEFAHALSEIRRIAEKLLRGDVPQQAKDGRPNDHDIRKYWHCTDPMQTLQD